MGWWAYRTNQDSSVDPDWGSKAHYSNVLFKVIVEPVKGRDWIFYLILPSGDDPNDYPLMATQACEPFLQEGDRYTVTEHISEKDVEEFSNAQPILMYNPFAKGDFIWIVPPIQIRH